MWRVASAAWAALCAAESASPVCRLRRGVAQMLSGHMLRCQQHASSQVMPAELRPTRPASCAGLALQRCYSGTHARHPGTTCRPSAASAVGFHHGLHACPGWRSSLQGSAARPHTTAAAAAAAVRHTRSVAVHAAQSRPGSPMPRPRSVQRTRVPRIRPSTDTSPLNSTDGLGSEAAAKADPRSGGTSSRPSVAQPTGHKHAAPAHSLGRQAGTPSHHSSSSSRTPAHQQPLPPPQQQQQQQGSAGGLAPPAGAPRAPQPAPWTPTATLPPATASPSGSQLLAAATVLAPGPQEVEVVCSVASVRFQAPDRPFKIVVVKASVKMQLPDGESTSRFAIKGDLPGVAVGLRLRVVGRWEKHAQHGWSLSARGFETVTPTTSAGVTEYLRGILKGVGPKTAAAMVDTLGPDVVQILNSADAIKQLCKVPGIKKKRAEDIKQKWDEGAAHHSAVEELVRCNVPRHLARQLADAYGADAAAVLAKDPYSALQGLKGATWQIMDALAAARGLPPDLPSRGAAALVQVLVQAALEAGDTHLTWHQLASGAQTLMSRGSESALGAWPWGSRLEPAAQLALDQGRLVQLEQPASSLGSSRAVSSSSGDDSSVELDEADGSMTAPGSQQTTGGSLQATGAAGVGMVTDVIEPHTCFMLPQLAAAQSDLVTWLTRAARRLEDSADDKWRKSQAQAVDRWLQKYEKQLQQEGVQVSAGQRHAIKTCLTSQVSVLTGGPGCGKTWATAAMLKYWNSKKLTIAACAPTGRAAQRLAELVHEAGVSATTIHRLLGYRGTRPKDADPAAGLDQTPASSAAGGSAVAGDGSSLAAEGEDSPVDDLDLTSACTFGKELSLPADVVLVDETSMMTLPLAAALCNALKPRAHMVLVGDPDQLPPVGPGAPLRDVIDAGTVPVTQLLELFRQEAGSAIVLAAREVNAGQYPSSLFRVSLALPNQQTQQPQQWQQQQPWRPSAQQQAQPVASVAAPRSVVAASADVSTGADTRLASLLAFWRHQLQQRLLVADPAVGSATGSSSSLSSTDGSSGAGGQGLLPSDALLLELPAGCPPEAVAHVVAAVVEGLLPVLGFNSTEDVQVLAPTWKEEAGVHALNKLLQPLVNPPSPSSTGPAAAPASPFQLHDRVMQMRNNVDKDVYNGDMGIVTSITPGKAVQVTFARPGKADEDDQDHVVTYEGLEVKQQLQLAWATTVHKAQGGEFPVVIVPLHEKMYHKLLNRTMLYTALTRAKQLVVVVATQSALERCLRPGNKEGKQTRLKEALQQAASSAGLRPHQRMVFGAPGGTTPSG